MSIEAMKLALEALQFGLHVGFDESSERQIQKGGKAFDQHNQAITALRQAIEQVEAKNCKNCINPAPCVCKGKDMQICGAFVSALQQEALDRKADNARELGLDYEPENTLHWHALNYRTAPTQNAQKMFEALEQFVKDAQRQAIEQAQKQEPVGETYLCDACFTPFNLEYECPKCGHGSSTQHPVYTSPPQRQPLTDEQISKLAVCGVFHGDAKTIIRAIEAAHGIKE